MDWSAWHDGYDDPDSWQARRLRTVRARLREALDGAPPGGLRIVSLCAGDGRDVLDVLAEHPRRAEARARLVELDARNTAAARRRAEAAGLGAQVETVTGDAALPAHYAGLVPADVVLVCGVFGNLTDADVERTVRACRVLCRTGGTVIWTRHREEPDLVPRIREWFAREEFEQLWLSPPDAGYGVGVHRFTGAPDELRPERRMFDFVGYPELRPDLRPEG
ncbi:class I SAM-dependent methyltransferase family protein [Kitasatospora phosalacinea]|uniref:class I SAM-dependent methyltransferase family protein n=1 Tax=Kitasatospora phosalacinea TaxID=2065 RepID=UPI00052754DD|nr:class I SAM-dependent methyltransferase family protein [Kitasatospora phosalacinea]